ncbi:MAG: hypothetical protein U0Q11_07300 [Vicinamibacterales bacterium]
MNTLPFETASLVPDTAWTPFPGGELEGLAAKPLCPACRAARGATRVDEARNPALCFQCFRLDVERNRKLKAAGELNTASEARFQHALPFEPVNTSRLAQLKAERQQARTTGREGVGACIEKRRRAQIEARHTLATIFQGLKQRRLAHPVQAPAASAGAAAHTSDLQLPKAWLPFVVAQ